MKQKESTSRAAVACREEGLTGSTPQLEAQIERLRASLRLAVVFGGDKLAPGSVVYPSHNTRPGKSYEAVATDIAEALRRIGFRHVDLMPDDMHLGERLRSNNIHMAWLNTGGIQGYNPTAHAAAMLEMFGMPYVGHDSLATTILDNKHSFKCEALSAGLPTAPFLTWHMTRGAFRPEVNARFQHAFHDFAGPFVVKPVSGRASLHVHVVDDKAGLPHAVEEVYRATENLVLIEKYLPGREFCIAAAGPISAQQGRLVRRRDPFTFAALERVLSPDERIFTSMDVRPITQDRCQSVDRRRDPVHWDALHRLARLVFLEFNLRSLVRIDMRYDENGSLHILEVNPKPDLKKPTEGVTNLISMGLPEAGMDYDDLILSLLADRLNFLLTHRRESVGHLVDLLYPRAHARPLHQERVSGPAAEAYRHTAAEAAFHAGAVEKIAKGDHPVADINALATDANLRALEAVPAEPARRKQRKHARGRS